MSIVSKGLFCRFNSFKYFLNNVIDYLGALVKVNGFADKFHRDNKSLIIKILRQYSHRDSFTEYSKLWKYRYLKYLH